MSKGKRLEIEQHLHFCACRRDCSLPRALAAPCLQIRRDWGTDQLETLVLSSSSLHFQQLFPLQECGAKSMPLLVCRKKATSLAPWVLCLAGAGLGPAVSRVAPCVPAGRGRGVCCPPVTVGCGQRAHTAWLAAPCPRYKPCLSTEARGSGLAASKS